MSEAYNPEADDRRRLESLELEARVLVKQIENAKTSEEREVLEKQRHEIEYEVRVLKAKLQ